MVKVEADTITTETWKKAVNAKSTIEGSDIEILNEALGAIQSLMSNLKKADEKLYAMVLHCMAQDSSILLGGDDEEDIKMRMARLTDKAVLGKGELS